MLMTDAAFQLTISAVGLATMIYTTNSAIDDALAMGTGQYMQNVAQAVNTYVFDNMTVLAASPTTPTNITAGSVTATVANPLHPTIQDLINLKLLPIGFSEVSPLGIAFKVDLVPTNCSGGLTNCTIPGQMYSTTGYRDASGDIRTDLMAAAVQRAGVDGGASYAENPALITGMAATWSAANPLPGAPAGVLMMRVGNTSLLAQSMNQFYKRDGSLNLTGPMDANNQAMNRVGNFQSNGSVSAAGNVDSAGSVSASGNVSAGANVTGNGVYGNVLQSYGNAGVAGNAYISGTTVTGAVSSSGSVNAGGSVTANGYLYASGAVVPSQGGGQQVYEGQGCGDPQGAIRSDPNGRTMSCQNGVWRSAGGTSQGTVVSWFSTSSSNNQWTLTGLCITWPGGTGDDTAGQGVRPCPNGTVAWVASSYQSGGGN